MSIEKTSYAHRLKTSRSSSDTMSPGGHEYVKHSRKVKKAQRQHDVLEQQVRGISPYDPVLFESAVGQVRNGQATVTESFYVKDNLGNFEQEIVGTTVKQSSDAA